MTPKRLMQAAATRSEIAPHVIIQQNAVSHYRVPLFELLSRQRQARFTIVADTRSDTPFLRVLNGTAGAIDHRRAATQNLRFGSRIEWSWQPQALGIVWRERPHLIIAMGSPYSLTAWALCVLGRLRGVPVLLWTHGLLGRETGPRWWIRRSLYRLATGLLLYGERARQLLQERGFDTRRMYVVYNSLDYDAQCAVAASLTDRMRQEWRNSIGVRRDEGLVVFTGRLQPVKRLDLLIDAIAKLDRQGTRIHVVLLGDGTQKQVLTAQAQRLGVAELVHFLGERYDENYLGLVISAADLSVIPSGAGLSVMHALVYGTPVLIHNRVEHHFPEWEAVREGETGFFYRYDDVDDLAARIADGVLTARHDPEMAARCQHTIAERYNPHRQVAIILDAVNKTLAEA